MGWGQQDRFVSLHQLGVRKLGEAKGLLAVCGVLAIIAAGCCRDVAQLGRALRSGRRGRRFKSCHPDTFSPPEVVQTDPKNLLCLAKVLSSRLVPKSFGE
jgi:hypothetical protein